MKISKETRAVMASQDVLESKGQRELLEITVSMDCKVSPEKLESVSMDRRVTSETLAIKARLELLDSMDSSVWREREVKRAFKESVVNQVSRTEDRRV